MNKKWQHLFMQEQTPARVSANTEQVVPYYVVLGTQLLALVCVSAVAIYSINVQLALIAVLINIVVGFYVINKYSSLAALFTFLWSLIASFAAGFDSFTWVAPACASLIIVALRSDALLQAAGKRYLFERSVIASEVKTCALYIGLVWIIWAIVNGLEQFSTGNNGLILVGLGCVGLVALFVRQTLKSKRL